MAVVRRLILALLFGLAAALPLGAMAQPPYLNQMVALETELAPRELLDALQQIERAAGRVRDVRWGPRTLDLDIVVYGDERIDIPGLKVPHPRAKERAFVTDPLREVWPEALQRL